MHKQKPCGGLESPRETEYILFNTAERAVGALSSKTRRAGRLGARVHFQPLYIASFIASIVINGSGAKMVHYGLRFSCQVSQICCGNTHGITLFFSRIFVYFPIFWTWHCGKSAANRRASFDTRTIHITGRGVDYINKTQNNGA